MSIYTQRALQHIRYLSENIGGRGSCTSNERLAGEYITKELNALGVQNVQKEEFRGFSSTYRPYTLAFGSALLGSLCTLLIDNRIILLLAAILNLLGVWAMFAETNFKNHWARYFSPKRTSQNILGIIPPKGKKKHTLVLCAHLDTHRTPIFYSSSKWQKAFGILVSVSFMSMLFGFIFFSVGFILNYTFMHWISIILIPFLVFILVLLIQAEFTPFSPGANDNASGVGVIMGLAQRILLDPMESTQIYLLFTGCEETGSTGIQAFLDNPSTDLGEDTTYAILDEVGSGNVKYLISDGLIIKYKTHPDAIKLARKVSSQLDFKVLERIGVAYTDALPVTLRGLKAITISEDPDRHNGEVSHWHQMTDTSDFINIKSLQNAHDLAWSIIQVQDRSND